VHWRGVPPLPRPPPSRPSVFPAISPHCPLHYRFFVNLLSFMVCAFLVRSPPHGFCPDTTCVKFSPVHNCHFPFGSQNCFVPPSPLLSFFSLLMYLCLCGTSVRMFSPPASNFSSNSSQLRVSRLFPSLFFFSRFHCRLCSLS